jgi:SAM-dependent methyltransferase
MPGMGIPPAYAVPLMGWKDRDWERLGELRRGFLSERSSTEIGGRRAYFDRERDLELYDAFFAQRIAWKWMAVLSELEQRSFTPPAGPVLDWGCGTGIATRTWLDRFGADVSDVGLRVGLWDHSRAARGFAKERVLEAHPGVTVETRAPDPAAPPAVLLVSHVLSELSLEARAELIELARKCAVVVWVESGDRPTARALSVVRESLLGPLQIVAPCPHAAACGVLASGAETEWCHHFAKPPGIAFQSRDWAQFSERLGIDLRSLPYSFLARAKDVSPPAGDESRILGRPRMLKGHADVHVCDATGVHERTLLKRDGKELFKLLKDPAGNRLAGRFIVEGSRILPASD